ncbi:MAG TPA: hypothetical protein ENN80_15020 [Candidatus Hydrogenedentes bacterium]|nr:hypothetical protein [Candidatus Hydrogenedentota bacterium]
MTVEFPYRSLSRRLLGVALAKAGRPEDALAEFDWVVGLYPDDADMHIARAESLDQLGEKTRADAAYATALGLLEARVPRLLCLQAYGTGRSGCVNELRDTYLSIAHCHKGGGAFAEALEAYRSAGEYGDPWGAAALGEREMLECLGREDEAKAIPYPVNTGLQDPEGTPQADGGA